jgi:hypothetical protein
MWGQNGLAVYGTLGVAESNKNDDGYIDLYVMFECG